MSQITLTLKPLFVLRFKIIIISTFIMHYCKQHLNVCLAARYMSKMLVMYNNKCH